MFRTVTATAAWTSLAFIAYATLPPSNEVYANGGLGSRSGCFTEVACSTDHSLVIADKFNARSLGADELDGCQVDGVQCANWKRKRIERAPQYRRHHFDDSNSADQATDGTPWESWSRRD